MKEKLQQYQGFTGCTMGSRLEKQFSDKYNTKIKVYPNGKTITIYCDKPIFCDMNDFTGEVVETTKLKFFDDEISPEFKSDNSSKDYQHMKRAREKLFDIVFMNDWANWCTFTFDPKLVDSTDKKAVIKVLEVWLSHKHQRNGLNYVLVPEYHKRSKVRIHIHCLTNDTLSLTDSGYVKINGIKKPWKLETAKAAGISPSNYHTIYNVDDWRFGWSTCERVYGTPEKIATYIQKYMVKDMKKIFGKYYWSSQGICREPQILYTDTDFETVDSQSYYCSDADISLKYETSFQYTRQ